MKNSLRGLLQLGQIHVEPRVFELRRAGDTGVGRDETLEGRCCHLFAEPEHAFIGYVADVMRVEDAGCGALRQDSFSINGSLPRPSVILICL